MKITRENIDNGNAIIKVLIEKKDYEKNVADKLKDYRLKAALPGFRPGKVPASLINKRFAKPVLAEEVNTLLSNNLTNYLYDEKIAILGDPLPNNELQKSIDWDADTDFEFVFDIAMSPEVKVDLENSTAFKYYKITVDENMIDESIESVRSQFGTNTEVDVVSDNSSVRGDFVQLSENGEILENGIVASGVLIAVDLMKDENAKNEIIGKSKGATLTFDPVKVFGDRHEIGHMLNISHEAAETLNSSFTFTVQSILQFTKPELNEDLFKQVYGEESGIATEEEFRNRISEEIAKNLSWSADQKFAMDARDTLVENTQFDLPEAFLKRWLMEANKEMTAEQVENEFDGFTKDLRWQLIKNNIIKENGLTVSEDEISGLARQIALSQFQQYGIYNLPEEHLDNYVKKLTEKEEDRERIVRRLFEDKVVGVVKEKGNLVEEEISAEAFRNLNKGMAEENA